MSDPAATKDLKRYNDLAPGNLIYKQSAFGFVVSNEFQPVCSALDPAQVLPLIADNQPTPWLTSGQASIFGITATRLPLPIRLPSKEIVAQVIRAIHQVKKLSIEYASLSDHDRVRVRNIEPHSLINTGLRWHVRAYNEDNFDFRDYVLSRIRSAQMHPTPAESSIQYDEDWTETLTLELKPHPKLLGKQRQNLLIDYAADGDCIQLTVRRALIGYVLRALSVDTTHDHSLDPNAFQLVLANGEKVEIYAAWALL